MIAHRFALHVPSSMDEAVDLAGHYGAEARALAGGTVLLPEMGRGAAMPAAVIDLTRCVAAAPEPFDGGLKLGPTTAYRHLEGVRGLLGVLARAITGGQQIRNRGTVAGSAAWANPSSDAPAVLLALQATLVLRSAAGRRRMPAELFFLDAFKTSLRPGELLEVIEVPEGGLRQGHRKLKFGESSWPIVTAAAVVRPDGRLRIAVGGATSAPLVVEVAVGDEIDAAVHEALVEPWSDVLADGNYRRRVAPVIARRAAEAALSPPGGR